MKKVLPRSKKFTVGCSTLGGGKFVQLAGFLLSVSAGKLAGRQKLSVSLFSFFMPSCFSTRLEGAN